MTDYKDTTDEDLVGLWERTRKTMQSMRLGLQEHDRLLHSIEIEMVKRGWEGED